MTTDTTPIGLATMFFEFREGAIESFQREGKSRAEAIAIINANKPAFVASFRRALGEIVKSLTPAATVH